MKTDLLFLYITLELGFIFALIMAIYLLSLAMKVASGLKAEGVNAEYSPIALMETAMSIDIGSISEPLAASIKKYRKTVRTLKIWTLLQMLGFVATIILSNISGHPK